MTGLQFCLPGHPPSCWASGVRTQPRAQLTTPSEGAQAHLGVVAHDVVEAGKQAQAGTDLTCMAPCTLLNRFRASLMAHSPPLGSLQGTRGQKVRAGLGLGWGPSPTPPTHPGGRCLARTLLYFGLPTLKEVEGVRGLGLTCLTTGRC